MGNDEYLKIEFAEEVAFLEKLFPKGKPGWWEFELFDVCEIMRDFHESKVADVYMNATVEEVVVMAKAQGFDPEGTREKRECLVDRLIAATQNGHE